MKIIKLFTFSRLCFLTPLCTATFISCRTKILNANLITFSGGYVYASYKETGNTPGYLISINYHGLPENDRRGPMGCVRFWYLLQGTDCIMELKLAQAFLPSPTHLFYDLDNLNDLWGNDTVTDKWVHVEVSLYVTKPFKVSHFISFLGYYWTFL